MPTFPSLPNKSPQFLHGADYNPDQWVNYPEVLQADIRLMKLARCNVMSVGIFAWAALEPEEGVFAFDWLDRVLDAFADNGIYAFLATPSGARPAWMSARYPEVLRTGANRVRNLHGLRHNHCYTSPVYREKTRIINTKLAERYARHPAVIGWHISNEYGGECHCSYCQEAFRTWLKGKYGSLEQLNHAWWTGFWSHTFTAWEQLESPAPHGENQLHGLNLDWRRFVTDQTTDFCRQEIAPLRACNPELPVTTNMMDFYEGLDYRQLAEVLDVISWDAYPTWHASPDDSQTAAWFALNHDLFRSLKGKPFLLMESTPSLTNWQPVSKLKRPGMHRLASLQAVAHGSDSVQYFQWRKSRGASEKFHGAVVDHAGHEHTRVFREVAELGRTLESLAAIVGTGTPAETAILYDWDNRWALKDAQGPLNRGIGYEQTLLQHYRAFWEQGIPVDIIGAAGDFSPYKLIVAPMMYLSREETGAKIERFVQAGGTFAATYWTGIVDENDLCHLGGFPGPLRRTLGVWAEEIEGLHEQDRNALGFRTGNELGMAGEYAIADLCEIAHLETAKALAEYKMDFYAGRPALTVNRLGKGSAYYLAARVTELRFYEEMYAGLAAEAGVRPVLQTKLPPGVTAQLRTDGASEYVFVMNFSGGEQQLALDKRAYVDAETGEPIREGGVTLPVHGVRILRRERLS